MPEQHIVVEPSGLRGRLTVPPSKSILHRSLVCAGMSGDLTLSDPGESPLSNDILATKECMLALMEVLDTRKTGALPSEEPLELFCGESGSTLRFLVPLAAALGVPARFTGEGRLPQRPMGEYEAILEGKGVRLDFPGGGLSLPLTVSGKMKPGIFRVPGHISSQYISGLLMALPLLDGDSEIELTTPLESEPYVEMTRVVMRAFGVETEKTKTGYRVAGGQIYCREEPYRAEPDFSQAAFWLTAAYLGHDVEVMGLPERSPQGDRAILELLADFREMYGSPEDKMPVLGLSEKDLLSVPEETESSGIPEEKTIDIDASQIPDLVPILAVAAAATPCVTRIRHAERLRLKECDRLAAVHGLLLKLGIEAVQTDDGLIISGHARYAKHPLFRSCEVDSYHDHRIVMAAAIAATRAEGPVRISDFRSVEKSYPEFFADFRKLGGSAYELNVGK